MNFLLKLYLLLFSLIVLNIPLLHSEVSNILPDGDFEKNGSIASAKSGKRCAVLKIEPGKKRYANGGQLSVEPFATYQAKGWFKGTCKEGKAFSLYSRGNCAFGWAFIKNTSFPLQQKWTLATSTFIAPSSKIVFCPIVVYNAKEGILFADDITIEKIKSPLETIRQLESKSNLTNSERMLLARFYLKNKQLQKVEQLLKGATGIAQADIAYSLSLSSDKASKEKYFIELLKSDAIKLPNGRKNLLEIAGKLSMDECIQACIKAIENTENLQQTVTTATFIIKNQNTSLKQYSIAEAKHVLNLEEKAFENLKKGFPQAADELKQLIESERKLLAERQKQLGEAEIIICGKALTAKTHCIVIPAKATLQERHAARELQYHLEQMTGQSLDIVVPSLQKGKSPIYLGYCKIPAEFGIKIDYSKLGADGVRIVAHPDILVLAGNKRGSIYAVYVFLEKYCKCYWFTPDCTEIPKNGEIKIGPLDYSYIPPFEMRDCNYKQCFKPEFGVRNRLNGTHSYAPEEWGGRITYAGKQGFSHTFERMVPVHKYYVKHPEYYSQIKGSKIRPEHLQLCLSNPEVKKIVIEEAKKWLRSAPQSKIISISHNDRSNYCRCKQCMAIAEKEKSQAGPLLYFVNGVADALKKEFPDVKVDTLAYGYNWNPPRYVKGRDNVMIRLAPIQSCFSHALDKCEYNQSINHDFRLWCTKTKTPYVWNYSMNYGNPLMPFPNLYAIKEQIRYFLKNGVKGVFFEGNHFSSGGEMAELRGYIIAQMLWDPECDTNTIIDRFLTAYYGNAAGYIRKYIELIHKVSKNKDITISTPPDYFLNQKIMKQAANIFDKAEQAVKDDPIRLRRVKTARLPVLYCRLVLNKTERIFKDGQLLPTENNSKILLEKFFAYAKAAKVTQPKRNNSLEKWITAISKAQPTACEAICLKNKFLRMIVVPDHGGRIWSVRTTLGQEIFKITDTWKGGYEEFCGKPYKSSGWEEKYKIIGKTDASVTLEAELDKGLLIKRKVELNEFGFKITSILKNCSKNVQKATLRGRPVFKIFDSAKTSVMVKQKNGSWDGISFLSPSDQRFGRNIELSGSKKPAGSWALFDESKLFAIKNDFDANSVDSCIINWSGAGAWMVMEMQATKDLPPNDSLQLINNYRLIFNDFPWINPSVK